MAKADTLPVRLPDGLQRTLITPEGVDLRVRLGAAGQRVGALLLDLVIMLAVLIVMSLLCVAGAFALAAMGVGIQGKDGNIKYAYEVIGVIWVLGAFLLRTGYFTAFEMGPRAATLGKRVMGLRVASRSGGRLTPQAVITRNAMRELELWLPLGLLFAGGGEDRVEGWMYLAGLAWACIFLFFPLFNKDRLRVGDLLAGTWVVHAPRQSLLPDMASQAATAAVQFGFTQAQLDAYGIKELHVLEQVLRTRERKTMAAVAARIRGKIDWTSQLHETDAEFLAAYYAGLRGRLENRLLFGTRRKDKHDKA